MNNFLEREVFERRNEVQSVKIKNCNNPTFAMQK